METVGVTAFDALDVESVRNFLRKSFYVQRLELREGAGHVLRTAGGDANRGAIPFVQRNKELEQCSTYCERPFGSMDGRLKGMEPKTWRGSLRVVFAAQYNDGMERKL